MDTPLKRCAYCHNYFPPTLEFFQSDKQKKDGLSAYCKPCAHVKIRRRNYPDRYQDFEQAIEEKRSLKEQGLKRCTHCKEVFQATNEFFHRNKQSPDGLSIYCAKCAVQIKQDNDANISEEPKQKRKEYQIQYRPRKSELRKLAYWANPVKYRTLSLNWANANRERVIQRSVEWQKNNPDKVRARTHRRRARIHEAGGTFTADDVKLQFRSQKGLCWWCGEKIKGKKYHADHLIPLARGGTNAPNNIVISCPKCNLSKGKKLPHEFNGRLF
jgi:5-methylcytosine-specific restriction endonuclease McrA